jgi:hypothetical protein
MYRYQQKKQDEKIAYWDLDLHNAPTNRQKVVPNTYSADNPPVLPFFADLQICGNQISEYVTAMKSIDNAGDKITRTSTVKNKNIIIPNRS